MVNPVYNQSAAAIVVNVFGIVVKVVWIFCKVYSFQFLERDEVLHNEKKLVYEKKIPANLFQCGYR